MVDADIRTGTVKVNGEMVYLSRTEYAIFLALWLNKGRAVSKDEIADRVWRGRNIPCDSLRPTIYKLRKKLGRKRIKTIQGFGYEWKDA